MYTSGTINTFTSRLHQLPTGQADLTSFINEGNGYTGKATISLISTWDREFQKRAEVLLKNEEYLISGGISGVFKL